MISRGFTLIELVISLAIAAIVGVALTVLLNQSYASQKKLDSITSIQSKATLFFTQLERDLMGATVPIENILEQQKQKTQKNKNPEGQKEEKTPQESQQQKEQAAYTPVEKVFYCTQNKSLLFFSWISRNPLQLYWGAAIGAARPRIARIMYRLEKDPNNKDLFKIIRSEGFDLSYAPYEKHTDKKYQGNTIIDSARSIKITIKYVEEKKEENPAPNKDVEPKKAEQNPVLGVHTTDRWEWPEGKSDERKEEQKTKLQPLPDLVEITLVLWDSIAEKEYTFTYTIPVPAKPNIDYNSKQSTENKETKKPDTTKPPEKPETTALIDTDSRRLNMRQRQNTLDATQFNLDMFKNEPRSPFTTNNNSLFIAHRGKTS